MSSQSHPSPFFSSQDSLSDIHCPHSFVRALWYCPDGEDGERDGGTMGNTGVDTTQMGAVLGVVDRRVDVTVQTRNCSGPHRCAAIHIPLYCYCVCKM